ncbi:MAG: pyridine nucleotide-disulfide oxidoreductase, partial [Gammaproteobacteria bacterium]
MNHSVENKNLSELVLGIPGFSYPDLHDPHRLRDLTAVFDRGVEQADKDLFAAFQAYRACAGEDMAPERISELLVEMAPHVGHFIARLFNIEAAHAEQREHIKAEFGHVFVFKNDIIGQLKSRFKKEKIETWDIPA